ncbi:hypothetical protein BJ878DRAFT_410679, partial [Calycina marina]
STRHEDASGSKLRVILSTQSHATVDGSSLSLLPLVEQNTGITHIIVSSLRLDKRPEGMYLNNDPPGASVY